jgi:hypothetical protein
MDAQAALAASAHTIETLAWIGIENTAALYRNDYPAAVDLNLI